MYDYNGIQEVVDLIKQFKGCRIVWLVNYHFLGLNDYVSDDMVDVIKELKDGSGQLKVVHEIDYRIENK